MDCVNFIRVHFCSFIIYWLIKYNFLWCNFNKNKWSSNFIILFTLIFLLIFPSNPLILMCIFHCIIIDLHWISTEIPCCILLLLNNHFSLKIKILLFLELIDHFNFLSLIFFLFIISVDKSFFQKLHTINFARIIMVANPLATFGAIHFNHLSL